MNDNKNDFYIGWLNKIPSKNKKPIILFIAAFFLFTFFLLFIIIFNTKKFNNYQFEFGNLKTFTGTFYSKPFPVLILDNQYTIPNYNNSALLVGYGKFGTQHILKSIAENVGNIEGKKIKISGSLIYGDGKILIELTQKEKSFLQIYSTNTNNTNNININNNYKNVTLTGEIIDPKCWFGVMKPAEGKVHKSCAIRCISGGIQPVLKVKNKDTFIYYVLVADSMHNIHKSILPYIAEQVVVKGTECYINGWNTLKINLNNIRYKITGD